MPRKVSSMGLWQRVVVVAQIDPLLSAWHIHVPCLQFSDILYKINFLLWHFYILSRSLFGTSKVMLNKCTFRCYSWKEAQKNIRGYTKHQSHCGAINTHRRIFYEALVTTIFRVTILGCWKINCWKSMADQLLEEFISMIRMYYVRSRPYVCNH